jgi:CRP/FNR family transcriptional regulator, cyclic AMP receptor protein
LRHGERSSHEDCAGRTHATINLVTAWPELTAFLPSAELDLARRVLSAPVVVARDQDFLEVLGRRAQDAFAFLIADGIVMKTTTLADRTALELLGPGDILAPPLSAARQVESRAVSRYLAHGQASVAMLDERFRQAARRWPGLSDCLHDNLGRQAHRASMHVAMLHLPRVEDRLVALFGDLAERFGRMTRDGIVIELPLTHELIGALVGSRRPTISLALQTLAATGVVTRLDADRWRVDPGAVSDSPARQSSPPRGLSPRS